MLSAGREAFRVLPPFRGSSRRRPVPGAPARMRDTQSCARWPALATTCDAGSLGPAARRVARPSSRPLGGRMGPGLPSTASPLGRPPGQPGRMACSRWPIQVFTMSIWSFTIPILAFTIVRDGCSRSTDLSVHHASKSPWELTPTPTRGGRGGELSLASTPADKITGVQGTISPANRGHPNRRRGDFWSRR